MQPDPYAYKIHIFSIGNTNMSLGKSVKLFLVDGSPNGILTAEIINWTGKILSAPRSKLAELIQRDECKKLGFIF